MALIFTNAGKAILANRLMGLGTEPKYFGWGTGLTTATAADTSLNAEAPETSTTKVTGVSSRVTTTVANDTYQVVATVTASAIRSITEVGLFDAAAAGSLYFRGNISAINANPGDSFTFTIKQTFS